MIRETLAIRRRTTGDNRIATAAELNNLGFLLEKTGRFAEAEPIIQEALALERSQCLAQKRAVPLERFKACAAPMFL